MKRTSIALLAVVLITLGGCGSTKSDATSESTADETGKSIELSADSQKIAGIEVAPASMRTIQESLSVPGVVTSTSKNRAMVTPPVAGRLVRLSVQLGDTVRQGQTLGLIESPELAQSWQSIAEAQRSRDAAAAELNQAISEAKLADSKVQAAKSSLERQRQLAGAGAFSQAPLQQAQSELNDAQSELIDAQRQLDYHVQQLQRNERLFKEGLVSKQELEASRLDVQLDQNRIAKDKARVELAKSAYEREKSISQKGLLNAREVQVAEAEVRSSQLERDGFGIKVRAARAFLANSEKAIRNAQATYRTFSGGGSASVGQVAVIAPIAGTITSLDVSKGQAVDRTQTLMEVENLASIWAVASVQEKDIARVSLGAACTVTTPSIEDRAFPGVVQVVASRLDPKTRSMPVQCLIAGSRGALRPGMFVTVRIGLGRMQSALTVAASAVVKDGDKSIVFVKTEDKFERRDVIVGTTDKGYTQILEGIKESEKVAVKGSFVLTSESKKDELKGEE